MERHANCWQRTNQKQWLVSGSQRPPAPISIYLATVRLWWKNYLVSVFYCMAKIFVLFFSELSVQFKVTSHCVGHIKKAMLSLLGVLNINHKQVLQVIHYVLNWNHFNLWVSFATVSYQIKVCRAESDLMTWEPNKIKNTSRSSIKTDMYGSKRWFPDTVLIIKSSNLDEACIKDIRHQRKKKGKKERERSILCWIVGHLFNY